MNFSASAAWEKEINNQSKTADEIEVNKAYNGTMRQSEDVDYYKCHIEEDCVVSLHFLHEIIDSPDVYWKCTLYTDTMKQLAATECTGKQSAVTGPQIKLPVGTYYLSVAPSHFSAIPYQFKLADKNDQQTYPVGDVDLNGEVTAADARLALRAAVGLENYAEGSIEHLVGDVDKLGEVTAADARMILRAAVGLENLGSVTV